MRRRGRRDANAPPAEQATAQKQFAAGRLADFTLRHGVSGRVGGNDARRRERA
jgi:hypothetical protein